MQPTGTGGVGLTRLGICLKTGPFLVIPVVNLRLKLPGMTPYLTTWKARPPAVKKRKGCDSDGCRAVRVRTSKKHQARSSGTINVHSCPRYETMKIKGQKWVSRVGLASFQRIRTCGTAILLLRRGSINACVHQKTKLLAIREIAVSGPNARCVRNVLPPSPLPWLQISALLARRQIYTSGDKPLRSLMRAYHPPPP
jgi:hypothetical protein